MANLLTPSLNQQLNLSHATHLKGNGGLKQAVTTTHALTKQYKNGFVIKTDIANYYASIQHQVHSPCHSVFSTESVCIGTSLQNICNVREIPHQVHPPRHSVFSTESVCIGSLLQ